ncbi:MAG: hypothetical protein LAN37_12385 [Acidobacteriia bacterium]|nr:hypothetical protein [Terriglobia bacterium]
MKHAFFLAALMLAALIVAAQSQQPAADSAKKTDPKTAADAKSSSSSKPPANAKTKIKIRASAILVKDFKPKDIQVPAQFQMAMYENTIEQIRQTGRFKEVYRDGDTRADSVSDLVILEPVIYQFKEGSARQRQVTTVSGASSIHVHVQLKDQNGSTLLEKDVAGNLHFLGENLRVTLNLAKNIATMVNDIF